MFLTVAVLIGKLTKTLIFLLVAKEFLEQIFDFRLTLQMSKVLIVSFYWNETER